MRWKNFVVVLLLTASSSIAITCYTEGVSNLRLQWNSSETVLNPSTVTSGRFGRLGTYKVDDYVYAHPLYAPRVTVGSRLRNLLIIADMSNYVYAFDADAPGQPYLWRTQTARPAQSYLSNLVYKGNVGCLATPVIDIANRWLFTLCANNNSSWVFSKLSLLTGSVISSLTVSATYPGTGFQGGGDCLNGGNVVFCYENSYSARPGLAIANGKVYLSFGQADYKTWHGWMIAYSKAMSRVGVWLVTPSGIGGSIWQSSGGPAIDASGNLYVTTGNGTYDDASNLSMSVVKLSPDLKVLDHFTPANYLALSNADADVSSGPPFIPAGGLVVVGMKDWNIYSIHTNCMGGTGGTEKGCSAPQIIPTPNHGKAGPATGIYGRMFMNGIGYFCTLNGPVYAFKMKGSLWETAPVVQTNASYSFPGLMMTGSSAGASGSLVWGISANAINYIDPQPGALRALNPTTLAEIWNSQTNPADNLGVIAKFNVPLVANGRVYVAGQRYVAVFGLRPR